METTQPIQKISKFKASSYFRKISWDILKKDKEITLFPLLSFFGIIFLLSVIGGFVYFYTLGGNIRTEINPETFKWTFYPLLFIGYLVSAFIITFFQAGLTTVVNGRLNNQDLTFRDGLNNAINHIGKIFLWSLFSATVGILLNLLSSKKRDLLSLFGGFAWYVATFFIVPVLILDDLSIFQSVKKSFQIFKEKWGESAIINISLSIYFALWGFVGILALILALITGNLFTKIVFSLLALCFLAILALISSSLNIIFRIVLYEYAIGKKIEGMDENMINSAITYNSK